MTKPPIQVLAPWLALLVLLAITVGMAYVPLGRGNLLLAMTIASAKALIVGIAFMKLLRAPPLVWIFAGAGVFWLALLFGLSLTDYVTRSGAPWQP